MCIWQRNWGGICGEVYGVRPHKVSEFDDALWSSLVEKIVVKGKEDVTVVFKDGNENRIKED